jgi:Uma2 family endonuclease
MKMQTGEIFYYPDVMVVCEAVDPDSAYQTQPVLLVEVISNSTESRHRLGKLVACQGIPSLKEYILRHLHPGGRPIPDPPPGPGTRIAQA